MTGDYGFVQVPLLRTEGAETTYLKVSCMRLTKYKDTAMAWTGIFFLFVPYDLLDNWVDKTYCILTWVESFFSTRIA